MFPGAYGGTNIGGGVNLNDNEYINNPTIRQFLGLDNNSFGGDPFDPLIGGGSGANSGPITGTSKGGGGSIPTTGGRGGLMSFFDILSGIFNSGGIGGNNSFDPLNMASAGPVDTTGTGGPTLDQTNPTLSPDLSQFNDLLSIILGIPPSSVGGPPKGTDPKAPTSNLSKILGTLTSPKLAAQLMPFLGFAGNLFGANMQNNQNKWLQDALSTTFGKLDTASQGGMKNFDNIANSLYPQIGGLINWGKDISSAVPDALGGIKDLQGQLPGMFSSNGLTPGMTGSMDAMNAIAKQLGIPVSAMSSILGNQGQTPALAQATGQALNVAGSQGNTPLLQALASFGTDTMNNGGASPLSDFFGNRGMSLANTNPLLSPELAASISGNKAANDFIAQQKAAQEHALARGGGPGENVYTGAATGSMADYADQGQKSMADAFGSSLLNQQGLGLTQQSQGTAMGGLGGSLAQNRLNTGVGAASDSSNQATQRLLQSLGLVPGMQGASTNLLGTAGSIFNQASGTQGSILDQILGGNLSARQLGISGASGLSGSLSDLLSKQLSAGGMGINAINSGFNALDPILSGYGSRTNTALGSLGSVFSGRQPFTNPFSSFLNSMGGITA